MKDKLKEFSDQWASIAVITVMANADGEILVTSEGCGEAGEFSDGIVNLISTVLKDRGMEVSKQDSEVDSE